MTFKSIQQFYYTNKHPINTYQIISVTPVSNLENRTTSFFWSYLFCFRGLPGCSFKQKLKIFFGLCWGFNKRSCANFFRKFYRLLCFDGFLKIKLVHKFSLKIVSYIGIRECLLGSRSLQFHINLLALLQQNKIVGMYVIIAI